MTILERAQQAKRASHALAALDSTTKNVALEAIALALELRKEEIFTANEADYRQSQEENLAAPLLKRLLFNAQKVSDAVTGLRQLKSLADPVGQTQLARELAPDLNLYRISTPIGLVGVIFESRPDALVQIASLCLKSGNAVLLKGGSEAARTNRILAEIITDATQESGIPDGWIQLVETRADIHEMFKMTETIDLLIPRGSNEFVQYIMEHSSIPVLGHADGICHIYADATADPQKATKIIVDSKTQYVAVCNCLETLLLHADYAEKELPTIAEALREKGVTLRGDERARNIVPMDVATDDDWGIEYLDMILSIKIVDSLEEAIDHINKYGSGHTDSIITESPEAIETFMALVDSACVFHNCSTRFSDGFCFGFGAEVGISTSKIHARGPVGLEGLLIYKYKLSGNGHCMQDFVSQKQTFTHRDL